MHSLIQKNQTAIAELCRRYRVKRLEVFGSAARGNDFDLEHSDADFLVEFGEIGQAPSLQMFFELRQDLERLIGRHVDLAEVDALKNPYLLASIEQTRELVYAARSSNSFAGKLTRIIARTVYCDQQWNASSKSSAKP